MADDLTLDDLPTPEYEGTVHPGDFNHLHFAWVRFLQVVCQVVNKIWQLSVNSAGGHSMTSERKTSTKREDVTGRSTTPTSYVGFTTARAYRESRLPRGLTSPRRPYTTTYETTASNSKTTKRIQLGHHIIASANTRTDHLERAAKLSRRQLMARCTRSEYTGWSHTPTANCRLESFGTAIKSFITKVSMVGTIAPTTLWGCLNRNTAQPTPTKYNEGTADD